MSEPRDQIQREGVWNPNGEGEQPEIPGGNAKDHARAKQPVIAYACLYPKLAAIARKHGYALAMHGSLVADCDLIAVPWVEGAASHETLAQALAQKVGGYLILDTYENRPAGVRKHIIHLGGGPYIDLAVFPAHAARIAELEAALRKLMKESAAVLALAEHELRCVAGNTNVAVFKLRVEEAGQLLAAPAVSSPEEP